MNASIITTTLRINYIATYLTNIIHSIYLPTATSNMVLKTSSLLVSLLSLVPFISTTPIPDLPMDDCSHWTDTYSVTSQTKYVAWPRLVTGVTVVGCNGTFLSSPTTRTIS